MLLLLLLFRTIHVLFATICFILNVPLLLLFLPRIGFYKFCLGMSVLDEELISNSRRNSATECDSLRHQMEMSFSIARTNSVINKQTGKMTLEGELKCV